MYIQIVDGKRTKGPRALPKTYENISSFNLLDKETLASHGWYEEEGFRCNRLTHVFVDEFELIDGVAVYTHTPIPEAEILAKMKESQCKVVEDQSDADLQSNFSQLKIIKLLTRGIKLTRKETKELTNSEEVEELDGLQALADDLDRREAEVAEKKGLINDCTTLEELDTLVKSWQPELV